ncbi:hypothetical protein ABFS83_08G132300 [Erythranthe nasuta]
MSISETSSSSPDHHQQVLASLSPTRKIQFVTKSVSERLLSKFYDVSEFDFDYTQSGIWSPPIQRSVFLNSPGEISDKHDMAEKLRTALARHTRRKCRRLSFNIIVQACLCSPKRF